MKEEMGGLLFILPKTFGFFVFRSAKFCGFWFLVAKQKWFLVGARRLIDEFYFFLTPDKNASSWFLF